VIAAARGLPGAFALFAAAFVLHIIGGATDQGWLFALAVALIYLFAAGFPVVAFLIGRPRPGHHTRATLVLGAVAGVALTAGALWAANDRAWAWWHVPLTPALVAITSLALWQAARLLGMLRPRRSAAHAGR
jgi:hypothetical protein